MRLNSFPIRSVITFVVSFSIVSSGLAVFPQDLVASEDILSGGGSSVFVFRQSRKKPQVKAAGGFGYVGARGAGRSGGGRITNVRYVAATKKRSETRRKANASVTARNRAAQVNQKIKLSNTLTAKADALMDQNQVDQAIETYRQALKTNPKNAEASSGLSDALTAKGVEVAGDSAKMEGAQYLEEAVQLDSKNAVAYSKLGDIYTAGEQTERGVQNYEKALIADPTLTDVYVPLGMAYLKSGDIAKAETYAAKADAAGSKSADAAMLRGLVYYKQNKNSEALASFEKALSIDPQNSSARYYEAACYDRLNQNDQSIAAYKKTVEEDPTYAPAWFDLGVAYYNAGDYNNAAEAYQQAIKYDPDNAQAHANLASTYRQLERYSDANVEYLAANQGIKNDPDMYSEWGYCLGKTNEWDKSVARLETASELSPTAVDNSNVGWAYYNAGNAAKANKDDEKAKENYEKGKVSLEKAVQQDPKLDAAQLNLGSTYNSLGEFQLAVAVLTTALSLHNDWVIAINQLGVG
jgi:tetratricopeptide (TPR) repeat protein